MPLNPAFLFGALNGNTGQPPAGSVPSPVILDDLKKKAEDTLFQDPKQSTPAYSPWQLAGTIAQNLLAQKNFNVASNAGAIQPAQTSQPGTAPAMPMPQQYDMSAVKPQQMSSDNGANFTTQNAQADNGRMNHKDAPTRNNNPGAMWPNPIATHFGATGHQDLADGKGNKIATFPDMESGAAAQFALLASHYVGMPIQSALTRWSTNPQYAADITRKLGLDPTTPITKDMIFGPKGIDLAAMMAKHEAGHVAPLTMDQWKSAQAKAADFVGGGTTQVAQQQPQDLKTAMAGEDQLMGLGAKDLVQKASFTPGSVVQPPSGPTGQPPIPPAAQISSPPGQRVAQNGPSETPPASLSIAPPNLGLTNEQWLSMLMLPPEMRNTLLQQRQSIYQPQVTKTPMGDEYYRPYGNKAEFIGKPLEVPVHAGEVGTTQYQLPTSPHNVGTPTGPGGVSPQSQSTMGQLGEINREQKALGHQRDEVNKDYDRVNDMALGLPQAIQNLQAQKEIMDKSPTFYSGWGAEPVLDIKKAMALVRPEMAADTELMQKFQAKTNLDTIKSYFNGSGLGRVLQKEVEFIDQANGSSKVTKEGLKALNEVNLRYTTFAQKFVDFTEQVKQQNGGILPQNWLETRNAWLSKNKPFTDEEMSNFRHTLGTDEETPPASGFSDAAKRVQENAGFPSPPNKSKGIHWDAKQGKFVRD